MKVLIEQYFDGINYAIISISKNISGVKYNSAIVDITNLKNHDDKIDESSITIHEADPVLLEIEGAELDDWVDEDPIYFDEINDMSLREELMKEIKEGVKIALIKINL